MRLLLLALSIFILVGCASPRTAQDAYKEGQYVESIELAALSVEEKGESKLDAADLEEFRTLVGNVMAHYENQLLTANRTDYASRINSYEALLQIKNRLSNRFYSQQVYFFNNKYDIKQLRQVIAEEYYVYGNSIDAKDGDSYRLKTNLYRKGLEQYNYKDIEALYNKTNKKYMQVAAKEYYDKGTILAESGLYQYAAESFASASEVYKPLGKYKNSDELFVVYDKKYRAIEAGKLYQQAEAIRKSATTHAEYREIAQLYHDAGEIYQPYGDYKGSAKLFEQYQQKGQLRIYFPPSKYSQLIQANLKDDYIKFVTNPSTADLVINIKEQSRYRELPPDISKKAMSENLVEKTINETNADGVTQSKDVYKTYYYNLQTTVLENTFELTTDIDVSGIYRYKDSDQIRKSSSMTKYAYSGQVPNNYRDHNSGSYVSQNKLAEQAKKEQERYVQSQLSNLATIFERL
ncbi:hypothetical protein DES39_1690 [Orbus hercynius]|uniref:Uncharacterized protein n=1 Tax=Orbus hercynius TaxID=593135 RepID=A0A495RCV6_9GAMM|nr:hypothetical protein [Orbus hercynius]RKS85181.1 hypothetical protein DES39_1690 [Orbus hercynius]